MTTLEQIREYIESQPAQKRADLHVLHELMRRINPKTRLWFLDGKDERGKVVTNPNIGYGVQTQRYADGSLKEFYQIGFSANTSGISVYIMGLADKGHLAATYGKSIGKATVTGYCIKFRALSAIDLGVLEAAIRDGMAQTST